MNEENNLNGLTKEEKTLIQPGDRFVLFVFRQGQILIKGNQPSDLELGHVAKMCERWSTQKIGKMPNPFDPQPQQRSSIVSPFAPRAQ